jgi:hypothetical protein
MMVRTVVSAGVLVLVLASCQLGTASPTTQSVESSAGPYHTIVYMLADSGGSPTQTGPFLAPVSRNVSGPGGAVEALLNGLTPSEIDLGISTEVPPDSALLGIDVTEGVATVDVSSQFSDGGDVFSMRARLAQLVFTITGTDPAINGVRLEVESKPAQVFLGADQMASDLMTRQEFRDLVPGILVEVPGFDDWSPPPLTIAGITSDSVADFHLEILDSEGNLVTAALVQTYDEAGWRHFEVTFEAAELPSMPATLWIRVYQLAKDGSAIYERVQPFGYRAKP